MSCIVGQSKRENHVEIEPAGCVPVSPNICKSGFMAPTENITKPKNSLDQCCKCQPGKPCAFCIDETKCTEDEKEAFMADEDDECFSEDADEYVPVPPSEPLETKLEPETEVFEEVNIMIYVMGLGLCLLFMILFSLSR